MKRLLVATTNEGKIREIRAVTGSLPGWHVEPLPDPAPEVAETGATFLDNAVLKAESYGKAFRGWTLADDSGLEVDALGGAPGVWSSRWAPTDTARISRLLEEMKGVGNAERGARFVCALALALDGKKIWTVEAEIAGSITFSPKGTHGFGYDPVFEIPGLDRTMAEIAPETKNRISHRGRALARLKTYLEGLR